MDLIEMYPAAVNSKVTVTLGVLNADSTIIEVLDGSVLPDAPTLLVLGSDQTAETVKLTAKEGNTLTVERGIQGNAIAWPAGTQIARNFTAKDWDDLVANVATIVAKIMGLTAADVHARPDTWMPTASDVGAFPFVRAVGNLTDLLNTSNWGAYTINDVDGTGGTPKTDGLTTVTAYLVFSYGSSANNGFQFAFPSGVSTDVFYFRRKTGGTVRKWTSPLVPDGSVPMSGNVLKLGNDVARWILSNFTTALYVMEAAGDSSNRRQLSIHGKADQTDIAKALMFYDVKNGTAVGNSYTVYGEHNKPSGSEAYYIGDGSATDKVIETGGIGDCFFVWGSYVSAFITPSGAICADERKSPSIYFLPYAKVRSGIGNIRLLTEDSALNANGVKYYYQNV